MNSKRLTIFFLVAAVLTGVLVAGPVEAQGGTTLTTTTLPTGITSVERLGGIIRDVANWVFAIFLVIAVIFILLAAFQFVTAGGDPEAVKSARTKLIYAAVGIAVALLAQGLAPLIENFLGV